jgi:hypothetical protein
MELARHKQLPEHDLGESDSQHKLIRRRRSPTEKTAHRIPSKTSFVHLKREKADKKQKRLNQ